MESTLSDLSLVSPSVAAAAILERDAAVAAGVKWGLTPSSSGIGRSSNGTDERFRTPLTGASNAPYGRLPLGATDLGDNSDNESNASTTQLLGDCKPNENSSALGPDLQTGMTAICHANLDHPI